MAGKRRFLCVLAAVLCIPLLEASADRGLEIIIVSQATPNITDYAAWSISVNGAYAKRNGYAFFVDRSDGGDLVKHQRDVRWSKVAILQNLVAGKGVPTKGMDVIEEGRGGGKGRERVYFWIDADAVFVNFEKRLEELVAGHSHKGMIISREGGGGTMANTGTFFLRENYRWGGGKDAGAFFRAWWNVGLANAHLRYGGRHEQQALDILAKGEGWVRNGIQLEPTERINSIPPFYATTNKDSFIMHLMFEPYGQLRELVFQTVYEEIVWKGEVPRLNIAPITRRLCQMSETAYVSSMRSIGKGREIEMFNPSDENHWGNDEDLIVMYAQLLTSCYGRQGMMQALSLYRHATVVAPHDPDTHRLFASRAIQFFQEESVGETFICEAEGALTTAMLLDRSDQWREELQEMLPIAAAACVNAKRVLWHYPAETAPTVIAVVMCAAAFVISYWYLARPSVKSRSKGGGGGGQERERKKRFVYKNWRIASGELASSQGSGSRASETPSGWGTNEWRMGSFSKSVDQGPGYWNNSKRWSASFSCFSGSPRRTVDTAMSSVSSFDKFDFAGLLSQTRAKSWAIHNDNGRAQWSVSDDHPSMPPPLLRRDMDVDELTEEICMRAGSDEDMFKRADSAPPLSPVLGVQPVAPADRDPGKFANRSFAC